MCSRWSLLEQAVKQRLVGVAVLAALAVITLPMVFDTERRPGVQVPEEMPPRPSINEVPVADPVPVAPQADIAPSVPVDEMYGMSTDKAVPVPESELAQPSQPSVAPADAVSSTKPIPPANTAQPAPLPAVPPAPGGKLAANGAPEAWVVQVAAMSDKKKADALIAQLKLNGQAAFARTTHTDKGDTIRVFIGPKLDRAQAARIKQKVDKDLGLQTMIVPFAPK